MGLTILRAYAETNQPDGVTDYSTTNKGRGVVYNASHEDTLHKALQLIHATRQGHDTLSQSVSIHTEAIRQSAVFYFLCCSLSNS